MICIHNFTEANQFYKKNLISYRLLQDQATVMMGIYANSHINIINALDISDHNIDWLLQQEEASTDYSYLLGGYVYICEVEVDLQQINGCNFEWAEEHNGQWPNVTDIAMSWDACSYLDEASGDPEWVIFLLCWNNSGGPVYYVPKHLWTQARVTEHIEATG